MSSAQGRRVVPVQSVDRAVRVLEFLAHTGQAGPGDIAAELGVHTSTVSRLVGALQRRALVTQVGRPGTVTLGPGLIRLADAAIAGLELAQLGTPVCANLADSLGETVTLAIRDGADAITISQAHGTATVATHHWTGQPSPLHATASGKVLLALATSGDAGGPILTGPLPRYTPRTITDPDELRTVLHRIRDDGYATCYEELELGLHSLAVPVYGHHTQLTAALSASGPAYRMPRQRTPQIAADLHTGALNLTHQRRNHAPL